MTRHIGDLWDFVYLFIKMPRYSDHTINGKPDKHKTY